MKLALQILFMVLLSFSEYLLATESTQEATRLNQLLGNLQTFKANFIQKITTETGESLEQMSGEIAIMKPARFYWNINQPFEQQLLADGKYLWQYDIDLEQVSVRDLEESLEGTPAQILTGSVSSLDEKFNITRVDSEIDSEIDSDIEQFLLLPKQEGHFQSIKLSFSSGALILLTLEDTLGQTTRVEFSEAQFGLALSPSLFVFIIPENVELVDSRVIN